MVSRLTALVIQSRDDIVCTAGGPTQQGKFVGWITLGPDDRYRPLLSTEPIYASADAAVEAVRAVVSELRATEVA